MYSSRDQLQPVSTGFLRFFAVPVCGSCILKLSGTGPVRGPSKKGNRTETRPDFKALVLQPLSVLHRVPFVVLWISGENLRIYAEKMDVALGHLVFEGCA